MKILITYIFLLLFFITNTIAQIKPLSSERTKYNSQTTPFFHGVASGDALHDRVIIWTRITPDSAFNGNINVEWYVATDTLFNNIVQTGTYTTNSQRDYTVKIDVTGLTKNTWYYYYFKALGGYSLIGRTKTLPLGYTDSIRIVAFSGANYGDGFFNPYRTAAYRNDFDAVFHLGDYIYEMGIMSDDNANRVLNPQTEILTLDDYRLRHSHYKLDPDLQIIHQNYPWYVIWDDHETANNSYKDGALSHDSITEGSWVDRKSDGVKAYYEWLPIREPDSNYYAIYRKIKYGDLCEVSFLETRYLARDYQEMDRNDTTKTMLGKEQFNWLCNNLKDTSCLWNVIAQQVVMAPIEVAGQILNDDQWDGYPHERKKLLDFIINDSIDNVVILTGDIHSSWANDVPYEQGFFSYKSAAVEFVTTSVSSRFPLDYIGAVAGIKLNNGHVKYLEIDHRGYYVLDINRNRTQADWYFAETCDEISDVEFFDNAWFVNASERNLTHADNPTQRTGFMPPLAPSLPLHTNIINTKVSKKWQIVGIYPNPVNNKLTIQMLSDEPYKEISISLFSSLSNKTVYSKKISLKKGINYAYLDLEAIASGMYLIQLSSNEIIDTKQIIKIE